MGREARRGGRRLQVREHEAEAEAEGGEHLVGREGLDVGSLFQSLFFEGCLKNLRSK